MKFRKINIMEENWDNLIILDTCRYDCFRKVYKDYVSGTLRKMISPATDTPTWLREVFGGRRFNDVVYVSANPFVNSFGVEVSGFNASFNARDCFFKVVDVWDWGWDDEMKTVLPGNVAKATRKEKALHPNKRLISHFMQPHAPHLTLGPFGDVSPTRDRIKGVKGLRSIVEKLAERTLGRRRYGVLRSRLGFILKTSEEVWIEAAIRKYGKKGPRLVYMENLRIVMEEVAELLKNLPGKSVITSDHGEYLGEHGMYGHSLSKHIQTTFRFDSSFLREVPWCEVK